MDKATLLLLQNAGIILSTALVYLITKKPFSNYFKNRAKEAQKVKALGLWEKGIEQMRLIRGEHYALFKEHHIPRNAFFVAHNGGSYPSKETDFFCSVKDETGVTKDNHPVGFKMQRDYGTPIKVDFSYAVMIEKAYEKGYVHYKDIDDMPDCLLKRIYKAEGVKESIIVFYSLDTTTFRFGYASHSRYEADTPFTEDQINAILLSGNRLRTQFNTKLLEK